MNSYYVYEWIRLDINEPFYVGKGKNNRCFTLRKRNKHFNDIVQYCENNSIGIAVSILDSNLSNKEALMTECWYIDRYIFEYGYNITNQTWGGDGGDIVSMMTPEQKMAYSNKMRISCLGKNKGNLHSEEAKRKMSESKKGKYIGENNPMYGKSVKDFMSEEKIEKWKRNISKAIIGNTHTEETKNKISKNVRRRVRGYLNNETFLFDSVLECKEHFEEKYKVSHRFIQNIINSNKIYTSNRGKYKQLNGLYLEKYK